MRYILLLILLLFGCKVSKNIQKEKTDSTGLSIILNKDFHFVDSSKHSSFDSNYFKITITKFNYDSALKTSYKVEEKIIEKGKVIKEGKSTYKNIDTSTYLKKDISSIKKEKITKKIDNKVSGFNYFLLLIPVGLLAIFWYIKSKL